MNEAALIGFIFVLGVTAAALSAVYWHHRQRHVVGPLPATIDAPVISLHDSLAILFEQLTQLFDYFEVQVLGSRRIPGSHLTLNPPMPTVEVSVEITVDSGSEQLPERGILQVMTSSFPPSVSIPEPEPAFQNSHRYSLNSEVTGYGRLCGEGRL